MFPSQNSSLGEPTKYTANYFQSSHFVTTEHKQPPKEPFQTHHLKKNRKKNENKKPQMLYYGVHWIFLWKSKVSNPEISAHKVVS